jgi:hypothetical protein
MTALRDEEIQKKGIVSIIYSIGQMKFMSDRPSKFAEMWWFLPIRLVAMHICYDQPVMDLGFTMVSASMEAHHLCRCRIHKGTTGMDAQILL